MVSLSLTPKRFSLITVALTIWKAVHYEELGENAYVTNTLIHRSACSVLGFRIEI